MYLARLGPASVRTVHAHGFLGDDSPSHSANSNGPQIVYLCDITVSSRGAASLPEEVRSCEDGGEPTVSQMFPIRLSASSRLSWGKEAGCLLLAEAGGINSQATSSHILPMLTSRTHNVLHIR